MSLGTFRWALWHPLCPFNFPEYGTQLDAPNAIALGIAIIKPSEKSALSCGRLAELLKEAGLPDGVFNYSAWRR